MPDLAFSELKFLDSRKGKADVQKGKSSHQKKLAADPGAEISRFFTSKKALDYDEAAYDSDSQLKNERLQRLPLVELPEKPFLGFGSSGATLTSPSRPHEVISTPQEGQYLSRYDKSSTHPTTYYSWSRSGAPSEHVIRADPVRNVPSPSSQIASPNKLSCSGKASNLQNKKYSNAQANGGSRNSQGPASQRSPTAQNRGSRFEASEFIQSTESRINPKDFTRDVTSDGETELHGNTSINIDRTLPSVPPRIDDLTHQDSIQAFDTVLKQILQQKETHSSHLMQNSIHRNEKSSNRKDDEQRSAKDEQLNILLDFDDNNSVSQTKDSYAIRKDSARDSVFSRPPLALCALPSNTYANRNQKYLEASLSKHGSDRSGLPSKSWHFGATTTAASNSCNPKPVTNHTWVDYNSIYEQQEEPLDVGLYDSREHVQEDLPVLADHSNDFNIYQGLALDFTHNSEANQSLGSAKCRDPMSSEPDLQNRQRFNPAESETPAYQRMQESCVHHILRPESCQELCEDDNEHSPREDLFQSNHDQIPEDIDFSDQELEAMERHHYTDEYVYPPAIKTGPCTPHLACRNRDLLERTRRAIVEGNDEVSLPGFWKPHILY